MLNTDITKNKAINTIKASVGAHDDFKFDSKNAGNKDLKLDITVVNLDKHVQYEENDSQSSQTDLEIYTPSRDKKFRDTKSSKHDNFSTHQHT